MRRPEDYHLDDPTWCPACGLYGFFSALKKAVAARDLDPEQCVVVTGIGCHGRLNNYFRTYGFHALHGRTLPVSTGIKLANPALKVLAISGDGDAYSIGLGHFIHALRRNINILYIVVDNRVFALTQGQPSPTSPQGYISRWSPHGTNESPLDGPSLALAAGGSFIARGFSGDPPQLTRLIEAGITHNGFALLEVLSPCVTHNKVDTYKWFEENTFRLEEDTDYDVKDKDKAWDRLRGRKGIPLGLIYVEERPSFENAGLPSRVPMVTNKLSQDIMKIEKLLDEFK